MIILYISYLLETKYPYSTSVAGRYSAAVVMYKVTAKIKNLLLWPLILQGNAAFFKCNIDFNW